MVPSSSVSMTDFAKHHRVTDPVFFSAPRRPGTLRALSTPVVVNGSRPQPLRLLTVRRALQPLKGGLTYRLTHRISQGRASAPSALDF